MTLAIDAVSSASQPNSTPATSLSWSHTCTSATDLVVCVGHVDATSPTVVTGVTYNSVAMSSVTSQNNGLRGISLWSLSSPTAGANTVAVTWGAATRGVGGALSFTGSNGVGAGAASINTSADMNVGAFAAGTSDLGIVTACMAGGQTTNITGVDDTQTSQISTVGKGSADGNTPLFGVQTVAGNGSTITMGIPTSASHGWAAAGVQVKAAAGGGGASSTGTGSFFYFRRRRAA